MQQGGVGGPYASIASAALVSSALASGPPLTVGFGYPVPANAYPSQVFTQQLCLPDTGDVLWNAYGTTGTGWGYTGPGLAGVLSFEPDSNGFFFGIAPAGSPGQTATFNELMTLSVAGNLKLPLGTLTVARDPLSLMDVATANWVGNNTVTSFNTRKGPVQLTAQDVYQALQLSATLATQPWVSDAISQALQNLLWTCPFVNSWNGRKGQVYLTLSDITCVFFQPGQQPISPTPLLTSNDNSIATTQWVTEYIAQEFAGGGGNLATQAWVLANTVNTFNGRNGQVTLTLTDVTDVGAAPLNSPNFSGLPTAPTAAQGQATGQIATTAFVQQAIAHNTAGVSTFNTRAGDVVLTAADIAGAGGLANPSPNLTGNPTAPTQPPGTNLPVIATCQFVQAALAGSVQSFNTRTGAVTLQLSDITGVGGAPLVSPAFSSVPTAPTAAPGTNTVQLATCAFVTAALNTAGGVSSFNGRTGVVDLIGNDISAAGGLVNPSVNLTGTPTAPTAPTNTNTTQLATCAFVTQALSAGAVTSFNTRSGAVVLTGADITSAGGALLAGPAFTGAPTAPTATAGTNSTQLATTQFVMTAIASSTAGVTSFNSRTGAVVLTTADITGAGGAPIASPSFTGTPQGPTATAGTSTTQLATTSFVMTAIASAGVASFNGRTGAVTLIANDISAAGGALLAGPTFTGVPAAPTAAPATNTTQLATCAFVQAAITALGGPFLALAGGTMAGVVNMPAGTPAAPAMVFGNVATQKGLYATGTALGIAVSGNAIATYTATGVALTQSLTGTDATFSGNLTATNGNLFVRQTGSASVLLACQNSAGSNTGYVFWNATTNQVGITSVVASNSQMYMDSGGSFFTTWSITAGTGYTTRPGTSGAASTGNLFNFMWVSPNLQFWLGTTNVGNIAVSSDYRIKRHVSRLGSLWDRVKQLRPVRYELKDYTPPDAVPEHGETRPPQLSVADGKERWGFIAHELQEALIEDAASGVKDQPGCLQSPNPWTLLAALTGALQEAMERLEALEARLA